MPEITIPDLNVLSLSFFAIGRYTLSAKLFTKRDINWQKKLIRLSSLQLNRNYLPKPVICMS